MIEFYLFLVSLGYYFAANGGVFAFLRFRDWLIGVKFSEWVEELKKGNMAVSVFLSSWVLGSCYLAASILS